MTMKTDTFLSHSSQISGEYSDVNNNVYMMYAFVGMLEKHS